MSSPINAVRSAGRLASFIDCWREITSDLTILEAIQGYKIPFSISPPPRPILKEPCFSSAESNSYNAEIERLLQKGALEIVESSADQFLSSFFLIKKSSGGMRFILNLRNLNSYISPPHFKLEDWRTVIRLMLPHYKMATIDLEDAYLLVPVHHSYRMYLRFQWKGKTYEYTALPFGLSTVPYIFTKIMHPIIKILREKGFHSIIYLDDFLLLGAIEEECQANVNATIELLSSLSFLINHSKSQLVPSSKCKYLGFIFNSAQQSISISPEKRRKLLSLIRDFSQRPHCSIKDFASMIGSLVSVLPAV